MLELSCHAWGFNNYALPEALAHIARLGFSYVDLGTGPHIDLVAAAQEPQSTADKINALLGNYDLQLADLYLMLPYINAPDAERRERQLKLLESLVPFAEALSTPGLTVSPGIVHGDGTEHSLARAVPALQRIIDSTENSDFRVSFELHMDSAVTTKENAIRLMEAVPGLSLTLDISHLIVQGAKWAVVQSLLEYTAHLHIRQATKKQLQSHFAQGEVDFSQLIKDLVAANYHGMLTVEYMTTIGWHGTAEVDIPREIVATRDALRLARSTIHLGG